MAEIIEPTAEVTELVDEVKVHTPTDNLREVIAMLNDHQVRTKTLLAFMKTTLKDVERQTKDFDKLRNKRSRNKSERTNNGVQSGITKPVPISDELSVFLGVEIGTMVPRNEVTKCVSAYVRDNNLSDPTNKQRFILNNSPKGLALKVLLGNPEGDVTYFNLQRYLKHHYIMVSPEEHKETVEPVSVKVPVEPDNSEVSESSVQSQESRKDKQLKKKLVLKKKNTELSEDK